ncbi:NUDIX domain-containing protein [Acetivibrio cellulolyticus]|uniref:NUDIX domain-containing protein n=1 Tax=Acetivibrio cellulolyticus TaxID=35830 RepID=UPI0001E2D92C|nr:NUDIX domain-containing protein [Acetivibrio cellulolyticus]
MKGVFAMLVKSFTGGVVFSGDKVLLLKNGDDWVLPREVLHNGELPNEVALEKITRESGVQAEIVSTVGQTSYECFSTSRQTPFLNKITWYIMKSQNDKVIEEKGNQDSVFVNIDEAMNMMKYSQDKSLVNLSFTKFREGTI